MAKVVITAVSDDEKFDIAITFVYRSWIHRRFDDVKLLFFGPSQRRLARLEGELMKMVDSSWRLVSLTRHVSDTRRATA
jgi:Uncharacterized protein conserved in archaea